MVQRFIEYIINEAKIHSSKSSSIPVKKISGSLVMKTRKAFKELLRHNIVVFKFQKRDGTIRRARGTLYSPLLPKVKYSRFPRPAYQMVYFDLDKNAWRSFRSFKFLNIVSYEEVDSAMLKSILKKREEEELRKKHLVSHGATKKDLEKDTERRMKEDEIEDEKREHEKKEIERKKREYDPNRKKHEEEKIKSEEKHEDAHEEEKKEEPEDEHKKVYKEGDKISKEELSRRSVDLRHGSRKNKNTHEANDKFEKEREERHKESHEEKHEDKEE